MIDEDARAASAGRDRAVRDPRVEAAFHAWRRVAADDPEREPAWRLYRRALIDWILDDERGPAPEAPAEP